MSTISESLQTAYTRLRQAELSAQRTSESVTLLAVSKTKPVEQLRAAYASGQRQFGENYLQEALEKIAELNDLEDLIWHFIGPIQSNKTKLIAESFEWVHTVCREKIANRLNDQRPDNMPPLNVCIQVNISGEASKSGATLKEVESLAELINQKPQLKLRGVMAIPENTGDHEKLAAQFIKLSDCFDTLKNKYADIDTLSVGMSQDLELAVQHGSTMVRLGTAIFGSRDNK